jgi:hypothetical protein
MVARARTILWSLMLLAVTGCHIKNQIYRPVADAPESDRSEISVPPPPNLPMHGEEGWPSHPEHPCDLKSLVKAPCLAFMEFDDFGEVWQKNPSGRPSQLQHIIRLIRAAKEQDPQGKPLIVTFLHGWKHNASAGKKSGEDDSNIIGFATVLNRLHRMYPERVVLGVYFAWRGGLISANWPVSQQFTYWNREATAIRVGNTSLTEALIEISDTARENVDPKCAKCGPVLVYVGHSFGALALERALSQATVTRMEREWEEVNSDPSNSQNPNIEPLANLVIYVNSAAAATESKQLMDYLASSHYVYRPSSERDEPLFLSVTSEADIATGLFLKVGHAVPLLRFDIDGSMRGKATAGNSIGPTSAYAHACFNPTPASGANDTQSTLRFDLSESDYYMSTTAHLPQLWSHQMTLQPAQSGQSDPSCTTSDSPTGAYMTCHIADHEYAVGPVQGRCNGTPYWVIQVPKELIPDHTTIFTERLIAFLLPFITSTTENRPQLSRPLEVR